MEELALYKDNEMITAADKESLKSAVTAAVRIPAEYLGTEYKFIYAFYNNGVLVDVASRTGAGENELNFAAFEFTVATESEFDEVRLFLWDSYNGVNQ